MNKSLKLIVENVDVDSFEYLIEEKNDSTAPKYYIKGPMILLDEKNQNGRIYESSEMDPAVETYIKEYLDTGRALGEMEHPNSADVNLERACDKLVSLTKEGNAWIGKAICLSTPMGKLQESLIRDGVKLGKSTRCLGQITEGNDGDVVTSPNVRAIDTVHNPSGQGKDTHCFVNGILENKNFMIDYDQGNERVFDGFEYSLNKLPRKDVEKYLMEQIMDFIKKIK